MEADTVTEDDLRANHAERPDGNAISEARAFGDDGSLVDVGCHQGSVGLGLAGRRRGMIAPRMPAPIVGSVKIRKGKAHPQGSAAGGSGSRFTANVDYGTRPAE
jgi:hypothetical protein